jgi:hypothetical protein
MTAELAQNDRVSGLFVYLCAKSLPSAETQSSQRRRIFFLGAVETW